MRVLNVICFLGQSPYHESGHARESFESYSAALTALGAILITGPNHNFQSTGGAGRTDADDLYRISDGLSIHPCDGPHCSIATCVVSQTIFAIKALGYEPVDVEIVDIWPINQATVQSTAVSDKL